MTEESLKKIISNIISESVQKAKVDFEACPPEMDAMEALEQVMGSNFGQDFDDRLFRTAKRYGIPDLGTEGIRAYVKAVSMPADKGKHLSVGLEVENSLDNRISIARLDGAAVNLYCSQLDVEAYSNREDDDGQMDLEDAPANDDDLDEVSG